MKISVIIPAFNRASFVVEALNSVLKQREKPDEIIIVDDGSEDETQSLLQPFQDKVKIIHQKNSGVSAARNTGIKAASHEWLSFLDSDDLWKTKKLLRQKEMLTQYPDYKICYTDEEWRKDGKWMNQGKRHQKYSGNIYPNCLPLCIISPSSVIIHKSVLDQIGLFDESLPACEDYDLWLRISALYPILFIPERLIVKRAGDWPQLSKQHSLDKYRILALVKMMDSGSIPAEHEKETLDELVQKCRIYKLGCEKYNKADEIEWIDKLLNRFA